MESEDDTGAVDRVPSVMAALWPGDRDVPGVTDVRRALTAHPRLSLESMESSPTPIDPEATWQLDLVVRLDHEDPLPISLWLGPTPAVMEAHLELRGMQEEERERILACRWAVFAEVEFASEHPLVDFHRQVMTLGAAIPEQVATLDLSAFWPRGARWVRDVAGVDVPPSPDSLFSIHAVSDPDDPLVWLHTHGLHRCGSVELDILDVPREATGLMGNLINTVAARFIEHGPPPPGEVIDAGGGLPLLWLPWDRALRKLPRPLHGHRDDRDDVHATNRGVLLVPKQKWLGVFGSGVQSPTVLLPILEDNPILFLSNFETARRGALAQARFETFQALFRRHGDSDDWMFLVKLGYPVDDAESDFEREHLWFQLHAIDDDGNLDATCLNAPYAVHRLTEGTRGKHVASLMSDWSIMCPLGRFDPDNLWRLEDALTTEHDD